MKLENKTILVTGGAGSFGQKFVEIVLREYSPRVIRVYSRGEYLQSEMSRKFNDDRLRFLIGDVRDKTRLYRAFNGVDIVVHAAAIKQVPTAEYNPIEAVNTNIMGAVNVIDAALDTSVEAVIAIGTDKEVHPINLYGATKLVAEKLFIQANVYAGKQKTMFSCTRYGNILSSSGSVIPLFQKQKESGEITITDNRVTRFWITLERGVRFVIGCIERTQGQEIFVPKIPSMKLIDVAKVIAPDARIKITGLRPGEKLHETLIAEEEITRTRDLDDYFIITSEFSFREDTVPLIGKPFPGTTKYSSDNNSWWLSKDELRTMLGIRT